MTWADVAVGDATFRRGFGGGALSIGGMEAETGMRRKQLCDTGGVCKTEEAAGSKAQDRKGLGRRKEQRYACHRSWDSGGEVGGVRPVRGQELRLDRAGHGRERHLDAVSGQC